MQTKKLLQAGKTFSPDVTAIKVTLTGPVMILVVAAFLAGAGLIMFFLADGPDGFSQARLGILGITLLICIGIAYAPMRNFRHRSGIAKLAATGRYKVTIGPHSFSVLVGTKTYNYPFQDFQFVGADGQFLNNTRNWHALVLSKRQSSTLTYKRRASIVRPVQKGHVVPSTYDGITTIPLVFFANEQYEEITKLAQEFHQGANTVSCPNGHL